MEDIDLDKISRVISQPSNKCSLRIHIKLLQLKDGRKENFHNLFSIGGNKYLKIDLQSFLTLELNDGEWSKDKSILIDQKNIFKIKKGFKQMYDAIYNEKLFAVKKDGSIIAYADEVKKNTVDIYNLGPTQKMRLKPAVIYDENEVSYEGVILFLNKSANYIELALDAFESLYDALNQVNLFVYSQLLLNYYMSSIKDEKLEIKENIINKDNTKNNKKHLLLRDLEDVKSTILEPLKNEEVFNNYPK